MTSLVVVVHHPLSLGRTIFVEAEILLRRSLAGILPEGSRSVRTAASRLHPLAIRARSWCPSAGGQLTWSLFSLDDRGVEVGAAESTSPPNRRKEATEAPFHVKREATRGEASSFPAEADRGELHDRTDAPYSRSRFMHLAQLPAAIESLRRDSRLRTPDDQLTRLELEGRFGDDFLDAASNDYLGTATASSGAEVEVPSGARASRLIFGSHPLHLEVEKVVADWVGHPSALLFTSGYAANVGALAALLSPEDAVVSDALNHASLIDGIRLSRARPLVVPHLDLGAVAARLSEARLAPARWVVVESYYSMDGDGPDLTDLRALCDRHDAHLYVDEAHSIGTFGSRGAGLCDHAGVRADVLVAAFGKSVGAQGACIASSPAVRTWLWNRARSFVYSTGMSPALAAVLQTQVQRTQGAEAERARLEDVSKQVRHGLAEGGAKLAPDSFGPVLAVVVGSPERALRIAERLRAGGILAQAVRPPTVPEGKSRIRVVLRASFRERDCERLVRELLLALASN